jgi:hypothetical protein
MKFDPTTPTISVLERLVDFMQYFSTDFSLYKTQGFSLHILTPFLTYSIQSVLCSTFVYFFYLSDKIDKCCSIYEISLTQHCLKKNQLNKTRRNWRKAIGEFPKKKMETRSCDGMQVLKI